jgi:hypothetical protein
MTPISLHPILVFDETKHEMDVIAKEYLQKATDDVRHLIPINVGNDGNCLYHSMVVLINDPSITASELRGIRIFSCAGIVKFFFEIILVRTIVELVTNENYYYTTYSQYVGNIDEVIKAVCKNYTYSELFEIIALCNVLRCNIRSVYPRIDFHHWMTIFDNVFTPITSNVATCNISILWSSCADEQVNRMDHNGTWSPNHFVPLLSPSVRNEFDDANQTRPPAVVSY